jgi:hypothetical protein
MVLSAVVTGSGPHNTHTISATVTRAEPGCLVRFRIGSALVPATVELDGHATVEATVFKKGRIVVRVTTTRTCSDRESASTTVSVRRVHVTAPATVHRGHSFTVHASGLQPGPITFTARHISGSPCLTFPGTADAHGNASQLITLNQKGLWVIVASSSGDSDSTNVRVF